MYRAVGLALFLASTGATFSARADDLAVPSDGTALLESSDESAQPTPQPDEEDTQEIGAVIGVALGGAVSPGGIALSGRYLYRLSEVDWMEMGASFSLGSGAPDCFNDRSSQFVCDHGLLDGFAAEASLSLRRYFAGQKEFRPFARLGLGLRLVSFSGDEVLGAALPVLVGGGVRAEVANRVLVVAEATLRAGPAFLNQDLGIEPSLSMSIAAGVEFTLE